MPEKKLPDILVIGESDFNTFFSSIGGGNTLEPVPAAPLHNSQSITLVVNQDVPAGSGFLRKDRKWFRLHPEENNLNTGAGSFTESPASLDHPVDPTSFPKPGIGIGFELAKPSMFSPPPQPREIVMPRVPEVVPSQGE